MGFTCRGLSMSYSTRDRPVRALEDVTFRALDHEFVCIVGPSGCGKTTLLKLIAGLIEPTGGHIDFNTASGNGQPMTSMVFQDHGLFPWMKVVDNVAFGLEMRGLSRRERRSRARSLIASVGLRDFGERYPHELSMGMRQRVGIARAFLTSPRILLMDEPFGSLDAQVKNVLQVELLRLWKEDEKTVVYVTHDIEEALLLGDRVLVMTGRPGRILREIPVPLDRPRNLADKDKAEIVEIKWDIWKLLEKEVRQILDA